MTSLFKHLGQQRGNRGPVHWGRVAGQADALPFRGEPQLYVDEDEAAAFLTTTHDTHVGLFDMEREYDYPLESGKVVLGTRSFENVLDAIAANWFTLNRVDWEYDKPRHLILMVWTEWFKEDRRCRVKAPDMMSHLAQAAGQPNQGHDNCLNNVPAPGVPQILSPPELNPF